MQSGLVLVCSWFCSIRIRITDNESQYSHIELSWPIHSVVFLTQGTVLMTTCRPRHHCDFSTKNTNRICLSFFCLFMYCRCCTWVSNFPSVSAVIFDFGGTCHWRTERLFASTKFTDACQPLAYFKPAF